MKSCCDEQIFQAILTQMPTEHAPRQVVVLNRCTKLSYSRLHTSPPPFFSKILEKPSKKKKKMIPHINGLGFSQKKRKKKIKMADLKDSKWPPQKTLIFQRHQFARFFHEIFMDWSLGW